MISTTTETEARRSFVGSNERLEELQHVVEHASHLLPAQGPITVFVHHNTLHAFEEIPFEEAVVKGGETFGCHPYLPEERYRQELLRGRIRPADLDAVLVEDLGDSADELLGFLGTRFNLRRAMLQCPFLTGPEAELRWIVEETEALRKFRDETSTSVRDRLLREVRQWCVRELADSSSFVVDAGSSKTNHRMRALAAAVLQEFEMASSSTWTNSTWEAFCLHLLWYVCREGVLRSKHQTPSPPRFVRHRDALFEATGEDSDELVHAVLIRFCAAFLDQGVSGWSLPDREQGFFRSFIALYADAPAVTERWLRGLRAELNRLRSEKITPLESIAESLHVLGIGRDEEDEFLTQTLLALRGWAGMIWQMETRGDRVAHPAAQGSLVEFLAIRLILERLALDHVARNYFRREIPLSQLRERLSKQVTSSGESEVNRRTFRVFQLAQMCGWSPEVLFRQSDAAWIRLLAEVEAFPGIERRRIFHLAYERRYRIQTLDALAIHSRALYGGGGPVEGGHRENGNGSSSGKQAARPSSTVAQHVNDPSTKAGSAPPAFQIVCCIDDREESFRRYLEEVDPECETFGAAGFFAVAMYYRGAADAHYKPLCPVIVLPQHYVRERVGVSFQGTESQRRVRRRAIGTVTHRVHIGSRTFAGGWLAAVLGSLASVPLVMRILFPRVTERVRRLLGGLVRPPVITQLQLERTEEQAGSEEGRIGYSVEEMAGIVERLLRDIGLTRNFSRLFIICGHGSSSLNNPHESAYDCGACGGGRGGPNARAWAIMANDPRVRERLAARGLDIPAETVFLGAYHNTCDDSVNWYDLDRLPITHRKDFLRVLDAVDEARKRNARERCRRFQSADLTLTPSTALEHVENRSADLSQARPECGHATNALCFVGRREWSRGLFLDRRAFLQSYDSAQDDEQHSILTRILQAVIPVCAGINLEYYFSYVDSFGYGCGTKLPHNIVSLLGVMNGAASDLRPGLPWQMVEIHEPVRLLFVIETTPEALQKIMEQNPGIARLCRGDWVQLATLHPETSEIRVFHQGSFVKYVPEQRELPEVAVSADWYSGSRDHLGFARVVGAGSPSTKNQQVGHPHIGKPANREIHTR